VREDHQELVKAVLRRSVVVAMLGLVSSIGLSLSSLNADALPAQPAPAVRAPFATTDVPPLERDLQVQGRLQWVSLGSCAATPDLVSGATLQFHDSTGATVGTARAVSLASVAEIRKEGSEPSEIWCIREARYSGTVGLTSEYTVTVSDVVVARVSLGGLRAYGPAFVIEVQG
jgi:hypothetical protein